MLASVDNPANNVEWILSEMLNQPEVLQKAVDEIDRVVGKERWVQEYDIPELNYVKACAREGYRLHPIAPFNLPHVSMQDMTIAGYFIPKGSHVLLSRYGLGRNSQVWEEPLKFDPNRHLNKEVVNLTENELRFISFSTGRRGCMGVELGTSMNVMLLARLLQGFSWSLPPNQWRLTSPSPKMTFPRLSPCMPMQSRVWLLNYTPFNYGENEVIINSKGY
ncbi:hypothetical protein SLA2020_283070 [Shorea laevis]